MAIDTFEEYTHELTESEKKLVPSFVRSLSQKQGAEKSVTSRQIIASYKSHGKKITGARIRKIINYIRVKGLVPRLIATSKGYYVSNNEAEIKTYINSLDQRANSIILMRDQMQKQLSDLQQEREDEF